MRKLLSFLLLFFMTGLAAQKPVASSSDARMTSLNDFRSAHEFISDLEFTNIGPTVFSGRVVDIEVNPEDPTEFYVAYASGGLWKTINSGTTFTPIFDHEAVITIGDVAVDWGSGAIWVGTGEVNSSRSSYAGLGVYVSFDDGKTWEHKGLTESHHIGKIAVHPEDPNTIWVGVLGHLYTENPERGFYRSTDGGDTWEHSLKLDNRTGIVDFVVDPSDPDIIYAASWERDRTAWNFVESGPGSTIYRSGNGGRTWEKMISEGSGFPSGEGVGRIGLAITSIAGETTLYALLDNYFRRPAEEDEDEELTKEDLKTMSKDNFLELKEEEVESYLRSNRFQSKYTAKAVIEQVRNDEVAVSDLGTYLENANSLLFDTPVIGAELYVSKNNGKSWERTHNDYIDHLYNSYGYYFGVIAVNPTDANQVYIAGVPILRSDDGGKSFKNVNGANVHVDHHRVWINPENPAHVILGNDGGINISYDHGDNWIKCNSPSVGQFYYINTDNDQPYNVYGGTQDNGVWVGSHEYREGVRWHNSGQYPYKGILGGDGMQVQIDTRDNETVYTGFQFGNYFRLNRNSGARQFITPRHELGERPYRWNWQSPIHVSAHNQDIVYFGAHKLFRSLNQGDEFTAISDDLTMGGKKGDVAFGTLTTIHESPKVFGLLYTGSDDGLIHVSKDGGHSWKNITKGLPEPLWVARVQASAHVEGRVYAALNGYRLDDFRPYVYVSNDYGETWKSIADGLPDEPVNVIKEDPHYPDIIYIGTDRATYVSLDMGTNYSTFVTGLSNAPVHDLVIHERDKDLLIGTHGRSIYLGELETMYAVFDDLSAPFVMAPLSNLRYRSNVGNSRNMYTDAAKNDLVIPVFSAAEALVQMSINTEEDIVVHSQELSLGNGLTYVKYDLGIDQNAEDGYKESLGEKANKMKRADSGKYYLQTGKYKVTLVAGDVSISQKFEIK